MEHQKEKKTLYVDGIELIVCNASDAYKDVPTLKPTRIYGLNTFIKKRGN